MLLLTNNPQFFEPFLILAHLPNSYMSIPASAQNKIAIWYRRQCGDPSRLWLWEFLFGVGIFLRREFFKGLRRVEAVSEGGGKDGFLLVNGPEGEGAVVGACDKGFFVDHGYAVNAALSELKVSRTFDCFVIIGLGDPTSASASAEYQLCLLSDFP